MVKKPSENASPRGELPPEVKAFLMDTNPWWLGRPARPVPTYKRRLFDTVLQRLKNGLAPVMVLRGPRQGGKTTLQQQIIKHLIETEAVAPKRVLRVQFDEIPSLQAVRDPILSVCRWFESRILQATFNQSAKNNQLVYIFFDGVQIDAPRIIALPLSTLLLLR